MYDVLPPPLTGHVRMGERSFAWSAWADILKPSASAIPLATYSDQFYAGATAAMRRRLGKGTVTYAGVDSLDGGFEKQLLRGVFDSAGVGVESLPDGLMIDWRDSFWVATKFTSERQRVPLGTSVRLLIGTPELPPGEVAV